VTVPLGFTLTEGLSGSLAAGASDTFTVRLDTATVGIKTGDITFTNNDSDENPFNFRIRGEVTPTGGLHDIGYTTVYGMTLKTPYRRAMPVTMPEAGAIQSVSIYHEGSGDGSHLILAVYGDASGAPGALLSKTASTVIRTTEGWQTVDLLSPVSASAGQTVWLAWVFENCPGVRDQAGSPGRADSGATWSGGMPGAFGASTQANYQYSIYATYSTGTGADPEVTVLGNGVSISDGDGSASLADHTDFGSVVQGGASLSRTYTVRNDGGSTLTLGAVTVPAGFTLTEGLSGSLASGASEAGILSHGDSGGQLCAIGTTEQDGVWTRRVAASGWPCSDVGQEVGTVGRSVRIQLADTSDLTLPEAKVFGTAALVKRVWERLVAVGFAVNAF